MTPSLPTCPYCNADLRVQAPALQGGRLVCARCGEPFRAAQDDAIAGGSPPTRPVDNAIQAGHPLPGPPSSSIPRRPNRILGLGILSGMAVVAVVALIFALQTQTYRRANDIRGKGVNR